MNRKTACADLKRDTAQLHHVCHVGSRRSRNNAATFMLTDSIVTLVSSRHFQSLGRLIDTEHVSVL